jgi:hypothetical protein
MFIGSLQLTDHDEKSEQGKHQVLPDEETH